MHPALSIIATVVGLSLSAMCCRAQLIAECKGNPPQQKWLKRHTPVFGGGALGTCFDAVFVKEAEEDHESSEEVKYKMYFSWRPKRSIASTTSRDGIEWDQHPTILLSPVNHYDDWEVEVNRPYVLKHNNTYHMWYTGQSPVPALKSRLGYAQSQDGVEWKRNPRPVLKPELPWEKGAIMCTHVLYDSAKSEYRMWYSAGDKYEPDAIGHAVSLDGVHWNRTSENPIFAPNEQDHSAFDALKVTCPHIIFDGVYYNMFYIGFNNDESSIGLARSKDGLSDWERHPGNPIIRHAPGDWDSISSYKPYLLHNGTHWLMWYNGRSSALEQIGLATYETKGENIYDFGFQMQERRCKVNGLTVINSAHMVMQVAQLPVQWQRRLLITAIADDKDMNSVKLFIESFESFGYERKDLGLVCTSTACSRDLTTHGIEHYLYIEEMCSGKLRCLISSAKISFVADALMSNVSVFYFDLDVYFKQDPLNNISSYLVHHRAYDNIVKIDALPVVNMLANYNGDGNLDDNLLSFGVFFHSSGQSDYLYVYSNV